MSIIDATVEMNELHCDQTFKKTFHKKKSNQKSCSRIVWFWGGQYQHTDSIIRGSFERLLGQPLSARDRTCFILVSRRLHLTISFHFPVEPVDLRYLLNGIDGIFIGSKRTRVSWEEKNWPRSLELSTGSVGGIPSWVLPGLDQRAGRNQLSWEQTNVHNINKTSIDWHWHVTIILHTKLSSRVVCRWI